jgi:CheY-like chemotaxis protein
VIEAFLSDQDYQLHYAANGQDAIDSLNLFQPDVILLDVMMPDIDGMEVCRRIKLCQPGNQFP